MTSIADILRESGLRPTHGRMRVYDHLRALTHGVSHEAVADATKLEWSTCWKALQALIDAGLVRRAAGARMDTGAPVWLYEATPPSSASAEVQP